MAANQGEPLSGKKVSGGRGYKNIFRLARRLIYGNPPQKISENNFIIDKKEILYVLKIHYRKRLSAGYAKAEYMKMLLVCWEQIGLLSTR